MTNVIRFNRLPLFVLPALLISLTVIGQAPTLREKYNFNFGWLLYVGDPSSAEAVDFNDSKWKQILKATARRGELHQNPGSYAIIVV